MTTEEMIQALGALLETLRAKPVLTTPEPEPWPTEPLIVADRGGRVNRRGLFARWQTDEDYLGRLRRHPSFTEVATGFHGSTEWAEFTIAAADWNPATGAKRKVTMTDERKAALRARLAAMREGRA